MQEVPYGYCRCGCGEKTNLAPQSCRSKGWVKGEPIKFIIGHAARKRSPAYVIDPITGCWVWQRTRSHGGYGLATDDSGTSTQRMAHRVMYERLVGPIPEGLTLDHLCRNPPCVNPDHLEPVTQTENARRGRWVRLTPAAVFQLRWCHATTTLSYRELGDMVGLSKSATHAAVTGASWA